MNPADPKSLRQELLNQASTIHERHEQQLTSIVATHDDRVLESISDPTALHPSQPPTAVSPPSTPSCLSPAAELWGFWCMPYLPHCHLIRINGRLQEHRRANLCQPAPEVCHNRHLLLCPPLWFLLHVYLAMLSWLSGSLLPCHSAGNLLGCLGQVHQSQRP